METDKEIIAKLDEVIAAIKEQTAAQADFEARLLEEFRAMGRTFSAMQARETLGGL